MKILNNHIVFQVETNAGLRNVLLDTGAGMTRSFDHDVHAVTINGRMYPAHLEPIDEHPDLVPTINKMIGTEVSAFVGPDVLETSDVLIDFENNTIEFGAARPEGGCTIDLGSYGGLPLLNMTVNGSDLRVGFDTGAQYPFVKVPLVDKLNFGEPIGQFQDFNPFLGYFTPSLYVGNIKLGTCDLDAVNLAVSPRYDETIRHLRVDGFLGINCLIENKVKVWISYANEQMVIVK